MSRLNRLVTVSKANKLHTRLPVIAWQLIVACIIMFTIDLAARISSKYILQQTAFDNNNRLSGCMHSMNRLASFTALWS